MLIINYLLISKIDICQSIEFITSYLHTSFSNQYIIILKWVKIFMVVVNINEKRIQL